MKDIGGKVNHSMEDDFIIKAQQARGKTPVEQLEVRVVSIEEDGQDSYKLILEIPNSSDKDNLDTYMDLSRFSDIGDTAMPKHEGIYFPIGAGIGIPPFSGEKSGIAKAIHPFLRQNNEKNDNDLRWLTPYKGYAGPDLAEPSKELLTLICERIGDEHPFKNHLKSLIADDVLLSEFQSVYDVHDLLSHFKGLVTAKDVWEQQPKGPLNRTYSIIPEPKTAQNRKALCFSVSVKKQTSQVQQTFFGENNTTKHYGINSSQLVSLKAGDRFLINKKVKPSKAFTPKTPHQKNVHQPTIFISQGNALERCITLLYEREVSLSKPPFLVFAGFKSIRHITGKELINEFLNKSMITQAHFALSRETLIHDSFNLNAHFHSDKRIDRLLAEFDFSDLGDDTVIYITGSEDFCDHIINILKENKTLSLEGMSMKVATSPNRLKAPSVAV